MMLLSVEQDTSQDRRRCIYHMDKTLTDYCTKLKSLDSFVPVIIMVDGAHVAPQDFVPPTTAHTVYVFGWFLGAYVSVTIQSYFKRVIITSLLESTARDVAALLD